MDVTIENDNLVEPAEMFRARLQLVNGEDAARVILAPNEANIIITDDDGESVDCPCSAIQCTISYVIGLVLW